MRMKKYIYILMLVIGISQITFGQLSGIKTIPGNYPSIAAAIAALNASGVGSGGVTFNVAAGHTETFTSPTDGYIITNTGTSANQIIFQKSGSGANPKITAATGTGSMDAIICFNGVQYITFDGIDVYENPANTTATTQMEWGYALLKVSATQGSQNITIKNATISLAKSNTSTYGIYSNNHTTAATTQLTVTAASGQNSTNKFYGNAIMNTYGGIYLSGFADGTAPYTYYDQNNDIGSVAGNTFTNFAGGSATAYVINAAYQNGLIIANNNITGGAGTTAALYGIYGGTANNADLTLSGNTVTLESAGTTTYLYAIYNSGIGTSGTSNTINIFNNTVQNCTYPTATTAYFYGIYNGASGFNTNMYGNLVNNNVVGGSAYNYLCYTTSGTGGTINYYNNTVTNNLRTGGAATAYMYCMSILGTATTSIHDNVVSGNAFTAQGAYTCYLYGIYASNSAPSQTVYNNTVHDQSITTAHTSSAAVYGVYSNPATTNMGSVHDNTAYNLSITNTSSGYGYIYGIYSYYNNLFYNNTVYNVTVNAATGYGYSYGLYTYGASTGSYVYKNKFYNATMAGTSGYCYGLYVSGAGNAYAYNNYISDLKSPASTSTTGLNGIYVGGGTNVGLYYNTVFLNATSTSTAAWNSSAVYISTTPTVDLRNNNFVNLCTAPGSTTYHASAYRRSSTTLTSYANTSDYNNFYAGTPTATNVIHYDGTNSYQTLADFQTLVSPRDAASVSVMPVFMNSVTPPYDLHINPATATYLESGGIRITAPVAVTDDFDGNIRQGEPGYTGTGVAPDIGADEFNGTPIFTCTTPNPGNTMTTANNLCSGQSVTLSLQNATSGTGVSYQWKSSPDNITYTDITGANMSTLTLTPNAPLYYKCTVTCQNGPVSATSNPVQITFQYTITSTTPATRCGPGTLTLGATASSGTINWYTLPSGGTSVGTGSTFVTPLLPATTTYYVATQGPETTASVGAPNTGISTSLSSQTTTTSGINFDVIAATVTILSLDIYPTPAIGSAFTFTVVQGSNTIATYSGVTTVQGSTSAPVVQTVPVNWVIPAGTGYKITATTNPGIIRNSGGDAFPYTVPGVISLTSSTGSSYYYNFYNWQVSAACSSPRVPVVATINVPPAVTANATPGTICSGQSTTLTASSTNPGYTYSWSPTTTPPTGATVSASPAVTTTYTVTATDNSSGPFSGCSNTASQIVTVNPSPSALNVTPATSSLYIGSIQQLTASGGTIPTQVLLQENFNTSAPSWVITNGPSSPLGGAWHYEDCPFNISSHAFTNFSTQDGGKFAFTNADAGGSGSTTVTMLTSPSFSTVGYSTLSLAFEQIYLQYSADITAAVEISTNGGSSWTTLADYFLIGSQGTTTNNAQATTISTIDLTAYINQPNVMIRYNYQSAWGYYWIIDNVVITGNYQAPITWNPVTGLYTDAGATVAYVAGTNYPVVYAKPTVTTTYTATATSPLNCTSTANALVTIKQPVATTDPAMPIGMTSATLNGTIDPATYSIAVSFEYGQTPAYGSTAAGSPSPVTGTALVPVSAPLSGLLNNTTYHFRVKGVYSGGTIYGTDMTFMTGCPMPSPAGPITGPATICANSAGVVYSVGTIPNATSYQWTLPAGASITAGSGTNVITVTFGSTSGPVTVAGTGTCGAGPSSSLAVTVNPLPVPTISGPASSCVNSTNNIYTTETGMTGYTWTLSAGGTITSGAGTNAITVTWATTGAKTVSVNYTNASNCTAIAPTSYAVNVNALPTPTITGNASVCQYTTGVVYTTQSGMTNYVWSVSAGGVVTAGGTPTSNSITINWNGSGAQAVTVNYTNVNGCAAVVPVSYTVTVNPAPVPTIGSGNNPCVGTTNNVYYTESGMTNYVWTISPGGVITSGLGTNNIHVTWNTAGTQWLTLTYTSASGCNPVTPTQLSVFVNPMPNAAGQITGTGSVCAGQNNIAYSTTEILNATSYTWTLPAGATIATGSGTRFITVNYGTSAISGNITVAGTNGCGNGPVSPNFPVTVNPLPAAAGPITGPANVCVNVTGVAYSVQTITGATAYVWTVPTGATITSGSGTKNIVVSFGPNPGSGAITVKGSNSCGEGAASTLNVTMNAIPDAPTVTINGNVLTSSVATGNQWYYEGTAIPGATGQTYTVINNTGYYWCVVTVNGCSSPISNKEWVVVTGQAETNEANFSIYPVPNDGRFAVTMTSPVSDIYTITVYNQIGEKIYELGDVRVNGTFEKVIDLRPVATGIYSVVFLNGEHKVVKKILVNR